MDEPPEPKYTPAMIKPTLAFALSSLLAFAAACRTANDRPVSGPIDYKCVDCDKTATADAGARAPLCCDKTMQVTSSEFAEEITYTCAMEGCTKTKTGVEGGNPPS